MFVSRRAGSALMLVFVLLLLALTAPQLLSTYLAAKLEAKVRANCASCQVRVGGVLVSFLRPGHVNIRDLHISGGDKAISYFAMDAAGADLSVVLWPLRRRELVLRQVTLISPDVTFIDADGHSPPDDSPPSAWDLAVRSLTVHQGRFHYVRNTHGTSATLNLHDIEVTGHGFGTTAAFENKAVEARALAQIEKSGAIDLKVVTKPWLKPLAVDVDLRAQNQNLADLTPFFKANAGVILEGTLVRGHGVVHVLGSRLRATVWAEYRDFSTRVVKMYDRNDVAAFFTNLGMAIAMEEKNKSQPHAEQTREVQTEREPKESIVSFILTGLKQAAIKVTMPELTSSNSSKE